MQTPEDVVVMPLVDVVAAYARHLAAVMDAAPPKEEWQRYRPTLEEEALSALEASQVVAEDLRQERVQLVVAALTYGADIEEVAGLCRWSVPRLVTEVQQWADMSRACECIDQREWRRVRRLVIGCVA